MRRPMQILATAAALLSSTVAFAWSGGWDWDEDIVYDWTGGSLQYAQDVMPEHPPFGEIKDTELAPPLEPWCFVPDPRPPTVEDCDLHKAMIDDWTHTLLDMEFSEPLPPGLPSWPHTCPSLCSQL